MVYMGTTPTNRPEIADLGWVRRANTYHGPRGGHVAFIIDPHRINGTSEYMERELMGMEFRDPRDLTKYRVLHVFRVGNHGHSDGKIRYHITCEPI